MNNKIGSSNNKGENRKKNILVGLFKIIKVKIKKKSYLDIVLIYIYKVYG